MDGTEFVGGNWTALVDWFTNHINNSAKSLRTNRHQNGGASVEDGLTANQTFGGVEGDGSHVVATQMLSDLKNESVLDTLHFESVENWGQLTLKLHVDDGANNLRNLSMSEL